MCVSSVPWVSPLLWVSCGMFAVGTDLDVKGQMMLSRYKEPGVPIAPVEAWGSCGLAASFAVVGREGGVEAPSISPSAAFQPCLPSENRH